MELFIIDNDGLTDINREWITTIKEFRKLFSRDVGIVSKIKDDSIKDKNYQRKREKCRRELTFIYHYIDFKSPFNQLTDDERLIKAAENANLNVEEIKQDEDLQAAIKKYQELQETRSLKLVNSGYKAIDLIRKSLETLGNSTGADVETVLKISKIINDLPNNIKTLKELDKLVKDELAGSEKIRGGSEKGLDEDPDED